MTFRPIRGRRRSGVPRSPVEHTLQALWRWRSEIVVVYISGTATVAGLIQLGVIGWLW